MRGIHRFPVNSPHKGQRRVALMFSLICVWINGWVNNREAGDLRRYRAHYDVTVMFSPPPTSTINASPRTSSCSMHQTMKTAVLINGYFRKKKITLDANLLLWLISWSFPIIITCIYSAVKQLFVCASGAVCALTFMCHACMGCHATGINIATQWHQSRTTDMCSTIRDVRSDRWPLLGESKWSA